MRWMAMVLQAFSGEPLLVQPLRRRLVNLIRRQPGIHASAICRETGHAWGTVQYHLRLLQEGRMITSVESGRERRFFPDGVDPRKAQMLMLMQDVRRGHLARLIQEQPGLRQVDLCRQADVSRKAFRATVRPLVEAGLVAEQRGLQTNRYYPASGLGPLLEPGMDVA